MVAPWPQAQVAPARVTGAAKRGTGASRCRATMVMGEGQAVAGEYDDYTDIDPRFSSKPSPWQAAETAHAREFALDYDERGAASGLGDDITARAFNLRCDPLDGGSAETMDEVVEVAGEQPDRGHRSAQQPIITRVTGHAITQDEREQFLHNYATTGCWNQSAYAVGRSGAGFKQLARDDPGFSLQVAEAVQDYRELLQMEIVRRGVRGVVEPVFGRGGKDCPDQVVGYVRKYSDRLLELEAKAAWPKRYRDQTEAIDGRRYGVLVVPGTASPEDWNREALAALQKPTAQRRVTRKVD